MVLASLHRFAAAPATLFSLGKSGARIREE
jgi:hypothetical protein